MSKAYLPEIKKKNVFITTLILVNCACRLGFMTNPIFFAQSGWLLGSNFALLIAFLVAYNMSLYCKVIEEIEKNHPNSNLSQMEDCFKYTFSSKFWSRLFFLSNTY